MPCLSSDTGKNRVSHTARRLVSNPKPREIAVCPKLSYAEETNTLNDREPGSNLIHSVTPFLIG